MRCIVAIRDQWDGNSCLKADVSPAMLSAYKSDTCGASLAAAHETWLWSFAKGWGEAAYHSSGQSIALGSTLLGALVETLKLGVDA